MAGYNTIRGLRVKYLSADPANAENGQVWYNSTTGNLRVDGIAGASSWASGGNLGSGRQSLTAAVTSTQTAGLVFGGNPAPLRTATEEYGGTSWTAGGAMSNARYQGGGAGTQTAGLVFGGYSPPPVLTATEEYDGSSWTGGGE